MALTDIYNALASSRTGQPPNQQIDLYAAANQWPVLQPLGGALGLFGIHSAYILANVQLVQSVSAVTLTGKGTFRIPGATDANVSNVTAQLIATALDNADRFELRLTITDPGWTFSKTFSSLPDTQQLNGQVVSYTASFLIGLPLGKPTFSARSGPNEKLHLVGELPAAGALLPYADLLAPWPLRLEGTVTLPAVPTDPPSLDLTAIAPGLAFQINQAALREVGLQIVVVNDLDPETYGRTAFSVLNLIATLTFGTANPIESHLSMPLLASRDSWRLLGDFEDGAAPLTQGLAQMTGLFGLPADRFLVPTGFDDFTGLYVSEIEVSIKRPASRDSIPAIEYLAITLGSSKEWRPPVPFVTIRDVGTRWAIAWAPIDGQRTQFLSGAVYGTVVIGGRRFTVEPGPALRDQAPLPPALLAGDSFAVDVTALIPQFIIAGSLRTDDTIPIGSAFRYFFGDPGPETSQDTVISMFQFEADPRSQTYEASATITTKTKQGWDIPLGGNVLLTLVDLSFRISVTQGSISGGISGQFLLVGGAPPGLPDPRFAVSAEYTGSNSPDGWVFAGALYPDTYVELVSLVANFLGITPPISLPTLSLERLAVRFATGSQTYMVSGMVVGRWTPTLFGNQLALSAEASVDITKAEQNGPVDGSLLGRLAINKIAVTVGVNLRVNEPTYLFKIEFGGLWLAATTSWRGTAPRHQVLTVQLGGVTLGGMLEYLVNLAAPTLGFRLEPPWDILNRIELSRFLLTIDPTENSVELVYTANADLLVMRVDTIGVRYRRVAGESAVELILTGRFLDTIYTSAKPLAWDVVSDPPPAVPGQGTTLLDLRYLGVGQRVKLKGTLPNTVRETLDQLRQAMQPVKDPTVNPLKQPSSNLEFAADSEWLIGLDVGLMETVELGLIFNDPRLYGLSVALGGERAGTLAGLRFEILYKKITNDIGMFRIELQVPQAFRHIELGAVSITLGVIVVEIYTNGNFLIDLGFPYNRNFERSFTVQVFPFIGRGGIYFGVLNGRTSRRVPAITNGSFAPVLELGIGLAVGVGKEVTYGPLSGGIYVEVQVVFQGVLAWFNPSSSGVAPSKYYWGQGIAAIYGKLYGKIDFKVIKVSVTLEAYAQASVIFEAYQSTVFRLDVGVNIEAEAEVLFFSVSFSFSAHLDVSFTVGSAQPTPWLLATGQGTSSQSRQRASILPPLTRVPELRTLLLRAQHLMQGVDALRFDALLHPAASLAATHAPYVLRWNPQTHVFTDAPRSVPITMLPAFSLTGVPVSWDGTQPPNANPQYRVAFLLFAPNGVPPRAASASAAAIRSAERSAYATSTRELSADMLIEALLRWSIAAVTGSPGNDPSATITSGQLHTLAEQMDDPATADDGFTIDKLNIFFDTNLWLQLSGDPGGTPAMLGGMVVPMPPFLSWTSPQAGQRNFATENRVGPLYEWGITRYLEQFVPSGAQTGPAPDDDPSKYESFATFVFRDWCLMIAKAAVQAAHDALTSWALHLTAPASLQDVANMFPQVSVAYAVRAGDTVDSVAAALGATPAELEYLNANLAQTLTQASAGTTIQIMLGIAPALVAVDSASVALAADVSLALGTIDYQVAQTDTLTTIAAHFDLSGPAALFAHAKLADDPLLLRVDAAFQAQLATFMPPSGFSTLLVAAVFYVRYYGRVDVPHADWYAQTIFDLNAEGALADRDYDQPIPPGTRLDVPPALDDTSSTHAIKYTTLPGDTLPRIGAALSLAQNFATTSGPFDTWVTFRGQVQPVIGGVLLPATTVTILPGETVNVLAERTIIYHNDLAGLLGWIGGAAILNPLALVAVPNVSATTGSDGSTLAAIAARFGLTVEDLAGRIVSALIFGGSTTNPLKLTIAHLPVQRIDVLVQNVLAGTAPAEISGMASRYLLSGLRLPAPLDNGQGHMAAIGPRTSLYDLTGQQFAGPVPDPTQPAAAALSVTTTVNADIQWIQLMGSTTAAPAQSFDALVARSPRVPELNRGLSDPARLTPGMVVLTDAVDSLVFTYTNQQLQQHYPATGLAVLPSRGPSPLPLAQQAPRTYGLDHHIQLQAPIPLPIPFVGTPPLVGNPALWPFSGALLERASAASTTPYEIVCSSNRLDVTTRPDTLQNATFATLLPFTIRRLEGREYVYELLGADTANRHLLLAIWQYLQNGRTPSGTQAFLLLTPSPNADNSSGLALVPVDAGATFLIKTNASTEAVPPGGAMRLAADDSSSTASQYYASFADLAQFVLLLWEGSVVGGTGCYLGFSTSDHQDLPASAFDERGNIVLSLLVIAGEQQPVAPQGRPLLTFNNCALVAPGLDPATYALFVEAADDSALVALAAVPPGNIGFTLTLPKPQQPVDSWSAETQLQQLFSLATYAASAPFPIEQAGFPVGPQTEDGQHLPLWQRQRLARWRRSGLPVADDPPTQAFWRYDQVLPITRFGPSSIAPDVVNLPDPDADPYRGITGAALPQVEIQLGFADVLGNVTAPPPTAAGSLPPGALQASVGYTDSLLGVGSWPSITTAYSVATIETVATLTVTIAAQPAALAPIPGQSPVVALDAAQRQAEKYAQIYFQLVQPAMSGLLLTSLKQNTSGDPAPFPFDVRILWRFVAANYAASRAAASVQLPTVSGTLEGIIQTYGLSYHALAAANTHQPIVALLGVQSIVVPAYIVFADGDTANQIVASTAPGWPKPASGAALLALTQNASVLPLRPGIVLTIPPASIRVPPDTPTPPLVQVAQNHSISAGLLANDNATTAQLLQQGFVFEMDALQVVVGTNTINGTQVAVATFQDVQQAFALLGVNATVADIALANGTRPGMLVPASSLTLSHYVTKDGDTLAQNSSGISLQDLVTQNADTANLFDPGALLYLGVFTPSPQISPTDPATLQAFAERYACPPALLLAANPGLELSAHSTLVVPGTVMLPGDSSGIAVPYTIAANDTLDAIAAKVASASSGRSATLNVAAANQSMPGTIAGGQTISVTVAEMIYSTPTLDGDSFQSVLRRLQAQQSSITLADLVQVMSSTTTYLAQGSLLLTPPAQLPAAGAIDGKLPPATIPTSYGVDAVMFAQANAGLLGLIAAGVTLYNSERSASVTTGTNDTFNSIVARFAPEQIDIAEIITANSTTPLLKVGALALLPPTPVHLSAALGPNIGPFELPGFPLTVVLRLQRAETLIDPAFRTSAQAGPVERADTSVPAATSHQDGHASLTLDAFAAAFMQACPSLRLATGKVVGSSADLWVVDFGSGGITLVVVAPGVTMPDGGHQPRFFALRPLYNDLVTRSGVAIRQLMPDGTLADTTISTDYQGVNVEVWARRFLADMDLFLTAPYAPWLYRSPNARNALKLLLNAKTTLAKAIARGLATVLVLDDPQAPAGLNSAIDTLEQQLAANLSSAYDIAALVQYDATVNSSWTRESLLKPGRLAGQMVPRTLAGSLQPTDLPYTLTNAKISLDQPQSFVNTLLRIPSPGRYGSLPVNLGYHVLDLEFNITPIGVEGYVSSDWLSFVPPLSEANMPAAVQTQLGPASVPIPLRSYPALPVLLGQSARPTASQLYAPQALSEASLPLAQTPFWTYSLTYSHEHAGQDEVRVTTTFNIRPQELTLATLAPDDLTTSLAKYIAVADDLWALLAGIVDADKSIFPTTLDNAANTFAGLAGGVAAAWDTHWSLPAEPIDDTQATSDEQASSIPAEPASTITQQSYSFGARLSYRTGTDHVVYFDTLSLTSEQATPGPTSQWPNVFYHRPDGSQVPLIPGQAQQRTLIYQFPQESPIVAEDWPRITIEWFGLSVVAYQNARASLAVRRNQKLLGPTQPDTAPDFLYQTPTIEAADMIVPLNIWSHSVDITAMGADVGAALQAAFQTLFGATPGLIITLGLFFGYKLVPSTSGDQAGLTTYLPISLYPHQVLSSQTANSVANALAAWSEVHSGEWVFSLTLYSQINSGAPRPLLVLERLSYQITG